LTIREKRITLWVASGNIGHLHRVTLDLFRLRKLVDLNTLLPEK
jgi:hypothetical protein